MVVHKVVMLGDGGVGKTAFVIQMSLGHFVDTYDPTIEDSYQKRIVVDGVPCKLDILDTAGQEEYTALRDQWIRDGDGFILMYSISSRSSLKRVRGFYRQIQRVKESASSSEGNGGVPKESLPIPIVLVGNKADLMLEREVSIEEGSSVAASLGVAFFEASAKNDHKVEESFFSLVRLLRRQRTSILNNTPESNLAVTTTAYPVTKTIWGTRRVSIPPEENSTESGRSRLAASLVSAVKSNDERLVLAYIEAGVDVNCHSGSDGSPLHTSAAAGFVNIVNVLLKKGASVNACGPTGAPPLQLAAAEGNLAVVKLLFHKGASIDQISRLHGTALMAAASRGRADIIRFLIKQGAAVSANGGPYGNALQAASWNGNSNIIRYLLDAGADVRARGDGGCTALQVAAFVGKAKAIQVLLDRGAKIDIDDHHGKYGSALSAATRGGHYKAAALLLDAGARPLDFDISVATIGQAQHGPHEDSKSSRSSLTPAVDTATAINTQDKPETGTGSLSTEHGSVDMPRTQSSPILPLRPSQTNNPTHSLSQQNIPISPGYSEFRSRPAISAKGFSTIHDSPDAAVDIVFIHGLRGHPENTWTYSGGTHVKPNRWRKLFRATSTSVINDIHSVFWPYDLLAQNKDFANTRIMTWGYDTGIIREFFGSSNQQNISQHGNNLLVSLQQERKTDPDRPLIFVAHSLGGIVLKVALDNSRRSQHQPQYLNVYSSTKGIVFLGTPHGGARVADWGILASRITKCALQSPSDKALRGLSPNSELLENLRKVFLQMLEDDQFGIHSFYETQSMLGIFGLDGLVVPYDSALVGHARKEISAGLHGNHSQICKFQGPDDADYKAVFGALQDYLIGATQPNST